MTKNNEYIPVVEIERRNYPHPERRNKIKFQILDQSNDRRVGDPCRRKTRGVSRNELEHITEVLREEQKTLINFISDKETKKQQVFKFQLTAIALLAAALIAGLPLFEQFIEQEDNQDKKVAEELSDQILLALIVFNVIGLVGITLINFTSAAVTRQITSIKMNIILAVRQLNCNREAIQDVIAARLCGVYPTDCWRDEEKVDEWKLAHIIYVRHNKFPIDNKDIRKFYMRRHRNTFIRFISFLFSPLLYFYKRKCEDAECKKESYGSKCYRIRGTYTGEWKPYLFNRNNDIDITEEEEQKYLPKGRFLRYLLFGYRAAFMRSADMMSVVAMSITTGLVALMIPAGNFYLWHRINILPIEDGLKDNVRLQMDEAWSYVLIFSAIDLVIILFFAFHFLGIIGMAMSRILSLLKSEPNAQKKRI